MDGQTRVVKDVILSVQSVTNLTYMLFICLFIYKVNWIGTVHVYIGGHHQCKYARISAIAKLRLQLAAGNISSYTEHYKKGWLCGAVVSTVASHLEGCFPFACVLFSLYLREFTLPGSPSFSLCPKACTFD